MVFNWFINIIQLRFDLIQTSHVCDLPPSKGTVSRCIQQMADLRGRTRDCQGERKKEGLDGEGVRRQAGRMAGQGRKQKGEAKSKDGGLWVTGKGTWGRLRRK